MRAASAVTTGALPLRAHTVSNEPATSSAPGHELRAAATPCASENCTSLIAGNEPTSAEKCWLALVTVMFTASCIDTLPPVKTSAPENDFAVTAGGDDV